MAAIERDGHDPPSILINNAGVNEISWLEKLDEMEWDRVMDTNAKGIFLMTQALLPFLIQSQGTVLNIVSNAAHMPMTGSLAYNASKGAAHIMTRQLAHELTRKHAVTVFGIAPNKLCGTGMSQYIDSRVPEERGWTPEFAKEYQLKSLLCGEETDPERLAEFIGFLLSMKERHKYLSGCILPYGA
jgi:NAD(P)-dependent dehydrogenase (short-subunit alcohol dehydrogenase family)